MSKPLAITEDRLFEIIATTFKHREHKIADNAARFATDEAVARVIEYLQSVGVLDEAGQPKPGQRMKVRIVDPRCYPPLVIQ